MIFIFNMKKSADVEESSQEFFGSGTNDRYLLFGVLILYLLHILNFMMRDKMEC